MLLPGTDGPGSLECTAQGLSETGTDDLSTGAYSTGQGNPRRNAAHLSLMRQLDGFYMTYPAWGYRGSRFPHEDDLTLLKSCVVQIFYSFMDGKGRALDPVRTERFSGSLKYEDVCIEDYEDSRGLRLGVGAHIADYDAVRPVSAPRRPDAGTGV